MLFLQPPEFRQRIHRDWLPIVSHMSGGKRESTLLVVYLGIQAYLSADVLPVPNGVSGSEPAAYITLGHHSPLYGTQNNQHQQND